MNQDYNNSETRRVQQSTHTENLRKEAEAQTKKNENYQEEVEVAKMAISTSYSIKLLSMSLGIVWL